MVYKIKPIKWLGSSLIIILCWLNLTQLVYAAGAVDPDTLAKLNGVLTTLQGDATADCVPTRVIQMRQANAFVASKSNEADIDHRKYVMCDCAVNLVKTGGGVDNFNFGLCKTTEPISQSNIGHGILYRDWYKLFEEPPKSFFGAPTRVKVDTSCGVSVDDAYSQYFTFFACGPKKPQPRCCCAVAEQAGPLTSYSCKLVKDESNNWGCGQDERLLPPPPPGGDCQSVYGSQGKVTANYEANGITVEELRNEARDLQLTKFNSAQQIIGQGIKVLLSFIGSLAIVLYIYAGLLYMTAAGNTERIGKAKQIFVWVTLGVVVMLGSYIVVTFIFKSLGIGNS